MKKILVLCLALCLVIGLVGAGVTANFSDTDTSSGNTFTAGTMDIGVWNGTDYVNDPGAVLAFGNLAPCQQQEPINVWVKNKGSLSGDVYVHVASVTDTNNGTTDAEAEAGNTTNAISTKLWIKISWNGTVVKEDLLSNLVCQWIKIGSLAPEETGYVDFYAHLDASADNNYQSDKSTAAIDFVLSQ